VWYAPRLRPSVVHVWLPKTLHVRCSIWFLQVHAALAAAEPADSWLPATEPHMADAAGHRFTVGHGPFPRALSVSVQHSPWCFSCLLKHML
jgi:hypothetical protein